MDDYIERQAAIDAFYPVDPENDGSDECTIVTQSLNLSSAEIESILCEIPAANVRKDVQGEWIDFRGKPKCFNCNAVWPEDYYQHNFCPRCGARMMDGDKNDE